VQQVGDAAFHGRGDSGVSFGPPQKLGVLAADQGGDPIAEVARKGLAEVRRAAFAFKKAGDNVGPCLQCVAESVVKQKEPRSAPFVVSGRVFQETE
jgi:hypothetical protein